ncbi:MAG: hypothetical protein AMXMBFR33_31990 [Candidatus Xenobia bacterium]
MSKLRLSAVGDILFGINLNDWSDPGFLALANRMRKADISFGNLEVPLVESGNPIPKIDIARADVSMADEIEKMGLDVLSLANNHIMDYGLGGLISTRKALRERKLKFAGASLTSQGAFAPLYWKVKNRRVALVAFHCWYHPLWEDYPEPVRSDVHKPGAAVVQAYRVRIPSDGSVLECPDERYLELLLASVARARKHADIVLVSMHTHFGFRAPLEVAPTRRAWTHWLVDAGADLILGHGPHAINGVESYKGRFIVHSMGNFIFNIPLGIELLIPESRPFVSRLAAEDQFWQGFLTEATFTDGPPTSLRAIPYEIVRRRDHPHQGMPQVARGELLRQIAERIVHDSQGMGVKVEIQGDSVCIRPLDLRAGMSPAGG